MIKEKFVLNQKETSIGIMQSKIDDIRMKDITFTGIRIYDNGFIGVAGAIGEYDEDKLEAEAKEALKLKIPYEAKVYENNKHSVVNECNIGDINDFIKEVEEILTILNNRYKNFTFANKVNLIEIEALLKNDKGLDLYQKDKRINFSITVKDKNSINIMDTYIPYNTRKYDRDNFLSFVDSILSSYNNIVELPNKEKLPVVMFNPDLNGLLAMKFFEDLNGVTFVNEASIFSGKLGEKLFNDEFTLLLTSNPEDTDELFFDAEGSFLKDYRYALIENGVIKSPYTDKKTALNYNLPLTAASTGEYDEAPSLRPIFNKMKLKQGEKTVKELLGAELGVFVFIAEGGGFTPEGNFGTPVQQAYLFDGEKFIGRLPELKVSSDLYSMFGKDFRGVSKNTLNEDVNLSYTVIDMKVEKL